MFRHQRLKRNQRSPRSAGCNGLALVLLLAAFRFAFLLFWGSCACSFAVAGEIAEMVLGTTPAIGVRHAFL